MILLSGVDFVDPLGCRSPPTGGAPAASAQRAGPSRRIRQGEHPPSDSQLFLPSLHCNTCGVERARAVEDRPEPRPEFALPAGTASFYARLVETKAALVLGGGGITGGMYELGALAAMDDFIVSGRKSGDFDLYVGISAGSILAAFLANGIGVREMCSAVLADEENGLLLRREDIYDLSFGKFARSFGRFLRNLGPVARHLKAAGRRVTLLDLLAALQQFLPAGLFSNANLERYVARVLAQPGRSNDFRTVRRSLAIVATDVDTGERWVFGAGGRDDVPISKAIQASTAIPVFFEPVAIDDRFFVDGAAERTGHLDIPAAAGADLIVMFNPVVPVYNDRSAVCLPSIDGRCRSIADRGVTAVAEQAFRINSRVKLELGAMLFRADHPETDLVVVEPSPAESSLFLYGSMNFAERVQALNYGYNSAVYCFIANFEALRELFRRHGMEVSLEGLAADRFLQEIPFPVTRRRFGLGTSGPPPPG